MENVILSCLESKNSQLLDHLLSECNLIGSILEAEKDSILTAADSDKVKILIANVRGWHNQLTWFTCDVSASAYSPCGG